MGTVPARAIIIATAGLPVVTGAAKPRERRTAALQRGGRLHLGAKKASQAVVVLKASAAELAGHAGPDERVADEATMAGHAVFITIAERLDRTVATAQAPVRGHDEADAPGDTIPIVSASGSGQSRLAFAGRIPGIGDAVSVEALGVVGAGSKIHQVGKATEKVRHRAWGNTVETGHTAACGRDGAPFVRRTGKVHSTGRRRTRLGAGSIGESESEVRTRVIGRRRKRVAARRRGIRRRAAGVRG